MEILLLNRDGFSRRNFLLIAAVEKSHDHCEEVHVESEDGTLKRFWNVGNSKTGVTCGVSANKKIISCCFHLNCAGHICGCMNLVSRFMTWEDKIPTYLNYETSSFHVMQNHSPFYIIFSNVDEVYSVRSHDEKLFVQNERELGDRKG